LPIFVAMFVSLCSCFVCLCGCFLSLCAHFVYFSRRFGRYLLSCFSPYSSWFCVTSKLLFTFLNNVLPVVVCAYFCIFILLSFCCCFVNLCGCFLSLCAHFVYLCSCFALSCSHFGSSCTFSLHAAQSYTYGVIICSKILVIRW